MNGEILTVAIFVSGHLIRNLLQGTKGPSSKDIYSRSKFLCHYQRLSCPSTTPVGDEVGRGWMVSQFRNYARTSEPGGSVREIKSRGKDIGRGATSCSARRIKLSKPIRGTVTLRASRENSIEAIITSPPLEPDTPRPDAHNFSTNQCANQLFHQISGTIVLRTIKRAEFAKIENSLNLAC